MKHSKIYELIGYILMALALMMACVGCTTFKTKLPNGAVFTYQRGMTDTRAARVDFFYSDPNAVLWIVIDDPNSNVHPGRLVVPPYFMAEAK